MAMGMALEDYLESIYLLGGGKNAVRLTDIARKLNVKKSTVVSALKRLQKEGLVIHERYGDVMLTQKGIELASKVYDKHLALYSFLSGILGVDDVVASKEACNLEHYISDDSIRRIKKLVEYSRLCHKVEDILINGFWEFISSGKVPSICEKEEVKMITLKDLRAGEEGVIKRVNCDITIKSRLLAMGIVPGETIRVDKIAPLGDPIDVIVKGYHLSLRKEEAGCIEVEVR